MRQPSAWLRPADRSQQQTLEHTVPFQNSSELLKTLGSKDVACPPKPVELWQRKDNLSGCPEGTVGRQGDHSTKPGKSVDDGQFLEERILQQRELFTGTQRTQKGQCHNLAAARGCRESAAHRGDRAMTATPFFDNTPGAMSTDGTPEWKTDRVIKTAPRSRVINDLQVTREHSKIQ